MIGRDVDVTNFTREQAVDFIRNSCRECDIKLHCNGADSKKCNDKVEYLVTKYKVERNSMQIKDISQFEEYVKINTEIDERISYINNLLPKTYDDVTEWGYDESDKSISVITVDYWSDGTKDYEHGSFPVEYLFLDDDTLKATIHERAELEKQRKLQAEREAKEKQAKENEERERQEYLRLKEKYEKEE